MNPRNTTNTGRNRHQLQGNNNPRYKHARAEDLPKAARSVQQPSRLSKARAKQAEIQRQRMNQQISRDRRRGTISGESRGSREFDAMRERQARFASASGTHANPNVARAVEIE